MRIRQEIGQAKATLFELMVNKNSSKKEIAVLRQKIVSLDKERLNMMFSSLDEVQKIISNKPEAVDYYRKNFLFEFHLSPVIE